MHSNNTKSFSSCKGQPHIHAGRLKSLFGETSLTFIFRSWNPLSSTPPPSWLSHVFQFQFCGCDKIPCRKQVGGGRIYFAFRESMADRVHPHSGSREQTGKRTQLWSLQYTRGPLPPVILCILMIPQPFQTASPKGTKYLNGGHHSNNKVYSTAPIVSWLNHNAQLIQSNFVSSYTLGQSQNTVLKSKL